MIIALAGRRIDPANSGAAYFPLTQSAEVKAKIYRYFIQNQATALVCSGACGADLLALDVSGELGMQRHLVLPFPQPLFRQRSVADCPGDWNQLFDDICREVEAQNSLMLLNYSPDDQEAYRKTNTEILNKAKQLLQENKPVDQEGLVALLVWNGKSKGPADTTAHFAEQAKIRNIRVDELLTIN
jgi:hypothetical protein